MSASEFSNLLLTSLPAESLATIRGSLRSSKFAHEETIYSPGDAIATIYFPEKGVVASIIAHSEEGASVEVGVVGSEGCIGFTALLGATLAAHEVVVQVPGECKSLNTEIILKEFNRNQATREVFLGYIHAVLGVTSQTILCYRLHSFEKRFARWLLSCSDRVGSRLQITQEFLAKMLGCSRATVNLAAGNLQRAGIIKYNRGKLAIVDRPALESLSCECYRLTRLKSGKTV